MMDTSAILAHYGNEPGRNVVDGLLAGAGGETALCVVSLIEIDSALRSKGVGDDERRRMMVIYENAVSRLLPVERRGGSEAMDIKAAARPRLPAMDALIAGCAKAHGATLVHKDPHFDAIPAGMIRALRLPDSDDAVTPFDAQPAVREGKAGYVAPRRKPAKKH